MRIGTVLVFDETINGTGPWYTSTRLNRRIGEADMLALQAITTGVGGSSPTLTVVDEESPDGEHWSARSATPPINGAVVSEAQSTAAYLEYDAAAPAAIARCKITMGGTSPRCRLRLYATLWARNVPWQR